MKILKICFLATLIAAGAQAAPKTAAQRAHERAQLRAAQREAYENSDAGKRADRDREHREDMRVTRKLHRNDNSTGEDISRNAAEAGDNIVDAGKQIRDFFGIPK